MPLADAMNALKDALVVALPGRVVTRDLLPFDQRRDADLVAGVLSMVSSREAGYATYRGREAQMGKLSVVVVGQLRFPEAALPSVVEDAVFAFVEEVKAFLGGALPVADVRLIETQISGQVEAPYGWFAMDWEVWP